MAWMNKPVCQRPVIGENQQSFGIQIQSSHRPYPNSAAGDQFRHRLPPLFIGKGGDIPPGFVEHQIDRLRRRPDLRAVQGHGVPTQIGLVAQFGGSTIDGNPPGLDVFLRCPPGTQPGGR